jgi:hypothetical protein
MKYQPLMVSELFDLKVGDSFIVYYAKDNDFEFVRLDYERLKIVEKSEDKIYCEDGWEWRRSQIVDNTNKLDTSRGFAYFYR